MRAVVILAFACLAQAQVYEVASIKPSQGGGPPGPRVSTGGRLNATNTTLKSLIEFAYDVRSYQISGRPSWLDSTGWDIVATPETPVSPNFSNVDHFRSMLRALLEDRFQLTVHKATRELPIYTLVIGKDGLKVKESEAPASPADGRLHMLESQKGPVEILIIDCAEKASEN